MQITWTSTGGFGKQGAAFHGQDTIATPGECQIVRDQNGGKRMRTMQARQQIEDHFGGPEIEVAGGFVGKQNGRLSNQSPGQHDALLFAPG
jgi:hypothetical protein